MPASIALAYDPKTRRADMRFDGRRFVLDRTPITTLLIATCTERRARADDELPDDGGPFTAPSTLLAKRGHWADALDPLGRLIGSRMWLLIRAKQTEATRRAAEGYLAEAVDPIGVTWSVSTQITVRWIDTGMLGYVIQAGSIALRLQRLVA